MSKKAHRIKKAPEEFYKDALSLDYKPVKLSPDAYPNFLKSMPPERLNSMYMSGPYESEETYCGKTLIGGMDVYRNAPDDPVKYKKDWYAIFKDPQDARMLLFKGPIKIFDEHWIDELPHRLKNVQIYYVPAKTD